MGLRRWLQIVVNKRRRVNNVFDVMRSGRNVLDAGEGAAPKLFHEVLVFVGECVRLSQPNRATCKDNGGGGQGQAYRECNSVCAVHPKSIRSSTGISNIRPRQNVQKLTWSGPVL
jgi:hypothetical protein